MSEIKATHNGINFVDAGPVPGQAMEYIKRRVESGIEIRNTLDIGANAGACGLYAQVNGHPDGHVVYVEPLKTERIQANIEVNDVKQTSVILPNVVWSEARNLPFQTHTDGQSAVNFAADDYKRTSRVDAITLREAVYLFNEPIDYFKMDIEGGEWNVLSPTDETRHCLDWMRFLDIEFHLNGCKWFRPVDEWVHPDYIIGGASHNDFTDSLAKAVQFIRSCGFVEYYMAEGKRRIFFERPKKK
jgi:FkbM family methyltransferase